MSPFCIEVGMDPEKPHLLHRDPNNKPRSSSWKLLVLIAIIVFGSLGYMVFHMVVSPHPPGSASPMEPKKSSP